MKKNSSKLKCPHSSVHVIDSLPVHFIFLQDPDNPAEDFIAEMEVKVSGAFSCLQHLIGISPVSPSGIVEIY